jgi:hypothetical protein
VLSLFITINWHCPISKILFKKGLHRKCGVLSYMKFLLSTKNIHGLPRIRNCNPRSEVKRAHHCAIGAPSFILSCFLYSAVSYETSLRFLRNPESFSINFFLKLFKTIEKSLGKCFRKATILFLIIKIVKCNANSRMLTLNYSRQLPVLRSDRTKTTSHKSLWTFNLKNQPPTA